MHRTLLSLAAPSAALAAALTLATPAGAATFDHEDATGDTYRFSASKGSETWTPAPEATEVDLTSVSVRHGRRIRITVTGADFTRGSGALAYALRSGRRQLEITQRVGTTRDFPKLDAYAYPPVPACKRITGEVDRAADTASVTVPRACLRRPDWVRAGVGHAVLEEGTRRRVVGLLDDALIDGQPGDYLALSPRVHRGPQGPVPQ